ncbi:MAG: hypothetical protein ACI8ZM_005149 [Crocinitomix sp.]|jgi:hypothetical protein
MKNQQVILLGIVIWLSGMILDRRITQYAYLLIHLGTILAVYGSYRWLRVAENRKQVNRYFFARKGKGFAENFMSIFDFTWARVSIIWTFCALGGMLIVHFGALGIGSTGAYEEAIKTIKTDTKVLEKTGEILGFSYMVSGTATTSGRSTLSFGVIGGEKNIRVTAVVHGSDGNYITKRIEIK